MNFYRQGKKLDYAQVIETLNVLIKQDILTQLEEQEIGKLFVRLFESTQEAITVYMEKIEYRIINIRQSFVTLKQLNKISDYEVWEQAIRLYERIIEGEGKGDEIVAFMKERLLGAMIDLKNNLKIENSYS